jgi:opacity protein-like surface antigen
VAGPGIYHRTISLTTPGVGFVTVCDPYWYVCFETPTEVDRLLGDRSSTDFGINAGGGYAFKVSDSAKLYVEARYLYVFGPDVVVNGVKKASNANGQFLPLSFGIRW